MLSAPFLFQVDSLQNGKHLKNLSCLVLPYNLSYNGLPFLFHYGKCSRSERNTHILYKFSEFSLSLPHFLLLLYTIRIYLSIPFYAFFEKKFSDLLLEIKFSSSGPRTKSQKKKGIPVEIPFFLLVLTIRIGQGEEGRPLLTLGLDHPTFLLHRVQ